MSNANHYDVIIIGSGAGGGSMARALAPTGKHILILERGGFLPREREKFRTRPLLPPPRPGERLRHGRMFLCDLGGRESHPDHPGPNSAGGRFHQK